jgi:hypothetical protein
VRQLNISTGTLVHRADKAMPREHQTAGRRSIAAHLLGNDWFSTTSDAHQQSSI